MPFSFECHRISHRRDDRRDDRDRERDRDFFLSSRLRRGDRSDDFRLRSLRLGDFDRDCLRDFDRDFERDFDSDRERDFDFDFLSDFLRSSGDRERDFLLFSSFDRDRFREPLPREADRERLRDREALRDLERPPRDRLRERRAPEPPTTVTSILRPFNS